MPQRPIESPAPSTLRAHCAEDRAWTRRQSRAQASLVADLLRRAKPDAHARVTPRAPAR